MVNLQKELKDVFECKIILTVHYLDWCFKLLGNQVRLKKTIGNTTNSSER